MTVSIVTGTWNRNRLFEYSCKYYQRLKSVYPFRFIVSCSEPGAVKIAQRYGHEVVSIPNTPLWKKMNASAKKAAGSDISIMIGDDDFITPRVLEFYVENFRNGVDYMYFLDWYFFDTKTKRGLYWGGYRKAHNAGIPCGAGRALSKRVMEALNWELWMAGHDRVLDDAFDKRIRALRFNIRRAPYYLRNQKMFCLDVKTAVNMTPFDLWDNTEVIDGPKMLLDNMPNEANEIMAI